MLDVVDVFIPVALFAVVVVWRIRADRRPPDPPPPDPPTHVRIIPRLDGCTCGGIGSTGAHHRECPWAAA